MKKTNRGFTPYHFSPKKSDKGFIALISAIIISTVLLLVATTASLTGFYGRSNILDSEFKTKSETLAEACVEITLLELANNPLYLGNATSTVGSEKCYVGVVSTSGGQKTFKTQGIYGNFYTNLEITVNTGDLAVISWVENPVF